MKPTDAEIKVLADKIINVLNDNCNDLTLAISALSNVLAFHLTMVANDNGYNDAQTDEMIDDFIKDIKVIMERQPSMRQQ